MTKTLSIPLLLASLGLQAAESDDTIRTQRLQEVNVVATIKENGGMRQQPSAVSLIGNEQLAAQHVNSLKGAGNIVPNLFIPDYGSRLTSAMYIRGIGSRINTPAVGLYVDNIPYLDKSAFDFNFYGVERLDVLRGPQGTLYGRNTMGGLIHVYTKNPMAYSGTDVKLSASQYHRTVALTHYHRPCDRFAFSAGGYYENGGGRFKNDITRRNADKLNAAGGRLRGIYNATDRLTFDLTVSYDFTNENAYPYYYTGSLGGTEPYPDLVGKISNNRESSYKRHLVTAGLNIEYRADAWQMNAITSYQHVGDHMMMDQDFIQPDIYTLEQRQRIHTLNEEVVFKCTSDSKYQWISGVNLNYQSLHTDAPVNFYSDGVEWLTGTINSNLPASMPMSISLNDETIRIDGIFDTPTFGAALFHQSSYQFNDHFSAIAGLRIDYERQQMDYNSPMALTYGFKMPMMKVDLKDLQSNIDIYQGSLNNSYLRFLPKVALKYDFDPQNNIYLTGAMGHRSGGYNLQMFSDLAQGALQYDMMNTIKGKAAELIRQAAAHNPRMDADKIIGAMQGAMPKTEIPTVDQVVYMPEFSWNLELGTHLTLLDRRLQLDAAVFYNRVQDQQIARFAPSGLGRMMVNAGKSQNYGGELSVRWNPWRGLAIIANYGFTHSKFIDYDGSTTNANGEKQGQDYSGNYVPFVPKHNMNIDASYTWHFDRKSSDPWWIIRGLTIGADLAGAGRIYWTEDNRVSQPFYAQLGARIGIQTQHIDLSLWARNITSSKYNTFYFESASRGYEQHSRPLEFGLDINLNL